MGSKPTKQASTPATKVAESRLALNAKHGGGRNIRVASRALLGDSVCFLEYTTHGKTRTATGFLMEFGGVKAIFTCNHVFPSKKSAIHKNTFIRFGVDSAQDLDEEKAEKFYFARNCFFLTNKRLDYTMISFSFGPGRDPHHALPLKQPQQHPKGPIVGSGHPAANTPGSSVWICHHPRGEPKATAGQAVDEVDGDFVRYLFDTDGGSSGSPVFMNGELVAIHHTGDPNKQRNEGTLITAVFDDIFRQMKGLQSAWLNSCESFTISNFGFEGAGKSYVTNALLGKQSGEIGAAVENKEDSQTYEVDKYETKYKNIEIKIFDNPGMVGTLKDNTHLQSIKTAATESDIVLLCIDIRQNRCGNERMQALCKQLLALRDDVLKQTVIVFTHCDMFMSEDGSCNWKTLSGRQKSQEFQKQKTSMRIRLAKCFEKAKKELFDEFGDVGCLTKKPNLSVNPGDLTIVTTGHREELEVYDVENWLAELWVVMIEKMSGNSLPGFLRATTQNEGIETLLRNLPNNHQNRIQGAVKESMGLELYVFFERVVQLFGYGTYRSKATILVNYRKNAFRPFCVQEKCRANHSLQKVVPEVIWEFWSFLSVYDRCSLCAQKLRDGRVYQCEPCRFFTCRDCYRSCGGPNPEPNPEVSPEPNPKQ